jgi:protein phosphatase
LKAFDVRDQLGSFDIIGDVHGCADELQELLAKLGYRVDLLGEGESRRAITVAPAGRRLIFLGDLTDRGPRCGDVLHIVMAVLDRRLGFGVLGNHDWKLWRWLQGNPVALTHGLATTVEQTRLEPASFHERVARIIDSLAIYLWLHRGALVVAHAGIQEHMIGHISSKIRRHCLHGDTDGETDEHGLPIRYNWAVYYRGPAAIVYGHVPVASADWLNKTICIDTACVFGGKLTALRWPERELVSVAAARAYALARRPLGLPGPRPGPL